MVLFLQFAKTICEFNLNVADGTFHPLRTSHIVSRWEDVELSVFSEDLTGDWVQGHQTFDFVTEELNPHWVLFVNREDLEGVATHSKCSTSEGEIVSCVLDLHESAQNRIAVVLFTDPQADHPVDVLLRRSESIDRAHCCDNDAVASS